MASFPTSVYYVRPDDSREDLIREVITAPDLRVLLVFPARLDLRLTALDLVLICRQANQSSHQVAGAARNPEIRAHIVDAGLPAFTTAARARRQAWRTAETRTLEADHNHDKNLRGLVFPVEKKNFPSLHHVWWEWAVFATACISLLLLLVFLFSRAEVVIHPQTQPQAIPLTFAGSPKVLRADLAGHLPVHELNLILDTDGSSFSSGRMDLPESYAQGEVHLVNLRDETLDVPQGLTLRTVSIPPIEFQTLDAVSLEPGEENAKIVLVQAVLPGEDGNVAAEAIRAVTGILGADLAVSNLGATEGGITRRVKTPTQDDVDDLREQLLTSLFLQAQVEFEAALDADQDFLIASTVMLDEIISEEVIPTPGETADRFHLSLRVRYTAWVVSTTDLESAAQQLLDASLVPDEKGVEGSLAIVSLSAPVLKEGEVQWDLLFQQDTQALVDPDFLQAFTAKRGKVLMKWMEDNLDLNDKSVIQHFPAWWPWLPPFQSRIRLVIQ